MNDCSTCPSRLDEAEVRVFFGKDFGPGVDGCAQFGHVLGRPGLDASKVQKVQIAFGKNCLRHGEPRPIAKPEYPEARVCAPHPEIFVVTNADGTMTPRMPPTLVQQDAVRSCVECANFIPENVVADELGFYLPLCAANGRLLLPKRYTKEPRSCGQALLASPGGISQRDTTDGMLLRPEYDDAFSFGNVRVDAAVYVTHDFTEPTEYPTDAEVTAGDAADGIRAWRRIFSPDGSRFVDLPIFSVDYFDAGEQAKIPRTGDEEHPEFYVDHQHLVYTVAAITMKMDRTPCLVGDAGTGKTEFFMHLAWLMCLPFDRISITRSSEVDDLAGKWLFVDGQTVWCDGRVASCWGRPGVMVLDEPNVGPDEVWQFVRPMTDNAKQLVLDASRGQRKERDAWRFFGLAMNPSWDIRNVGTNEISDADGNRLMSITVGLPPESIERKILQQACLGNGGYELPADTLDKIMAIAADLRAAVENESINASWGIRPQIAVAQATQWFDLQTCYALALGNRLDPPTRELIRSIVDGFESAPMVTMPF